MAERQAIQIRWLKHKAIIHKITFKKAVELYAEQFSILWDLIERSKK